MHERNIPIYTTSLDHILHNARPAEPQPLHSPEEWKKRSDEFDQFHAKDVSHAIAEAADMHADVHLYRKIGSHFLGIGFEQGDGPMVKIIEHPERHN